MRAIVNSDSVQARLQKEMGAANEKFAHLDDKFKNVEGERDVLRKKVKDTEIKIEVRCLLFPEVTFSGPQQETE